MSCQTFAGWRFVPKTIFGGQHEHLVATLRAARRASGLKQAQLAQRLGRDQTFVSLIERGQRRVDVIEFFQIAQALGRDPVELFADLAARMASSD